MQAAVRKHPIKIMFKARTPKRVIKTIRDQFSEYIDDSDELVDWFETDEYKEIAKKQTPGSALRNYREMAGWTLAETGEKIGVSPYRISDFENGQRTISKTMAKKLAVIFNTSPAVFI